ncbi:RuBisCO-associated protein [Glycine max]|nr:RuBisCO-associated protein [Glycine max]
MAVFREYTSDDSFTKVDIPKDVSEFQDTTIVTPQVINNFKKRFSSAKVLVSIGNDKSHFPFKINEDNVSAWIDVATKLLTHIIQSTTWMVLMFITRTLWSRTPLVVFVFSVGEVIKNLKLKKVITRASISPNNDTSNEYYSPLYKDYKNFNDQVLFQCFTSSVADTTTKMTFYIG